MEVEVAEAGAASRWSSPSPSQSRGDMPGVELRMEVGMLRVMCGGWVVAAVHVGSWQQ